MFFKAATIHRFEHRVRELGLDKGVTELLLHRNFIQIGVGLFGIFTPIFLYELLGQRAWASILYVIGFYVLSLFLQPIAAKIITRVGLKVGLMLGVALLGMTYYVFSIGASLSIPVFVACALGFSSLYHVVYWLPYHVEFIELTPTQKRGRIMGYFAAISSLVGVVTPIIAGFSIERFGYARLIWACLIALVLSLIPLFFIHTVKERYSYSYLQTFRELLAPHNRMLLFVYAMEGAENMVGSIIWPIFLFQVMKGDYIAIGLNTGIIVAASCILQLILGFMIEKKGKTGEKLLHVGVGLSSLGWLMKAFVTTISQVVFAGIYHSFALIIERAPFEAVMYARAADAGHYIDEYTVLREMALNFGRIAMLSCCLVCVVFAGYWPTFILAAVATLGFNLVTRLQPVARLSK